MGRGAVSRAETVLAACDAPVRLAVRFAEAAPFVPGGAAADEGCEMLGMLGLGAWSGDLGCDAEALLRGVRCALHAAAVREPCVAAGRPAGDAARPFLLFGMMSVCALRARSRLVPGFDSVWSGMAEAEMADVGACRFLGRSSGIGRKYFAAVIRGARSAVSLTAYCHAADVLTADCSLLAAGYAPDMAVGDAQRQADASSIVGPGEGGCGR